MIRDAVLYSWILQGIRRGGGPPVDTIALYQPESSYKPLYGFYCRHQPQLAPNQAQECINALVQLCVFGSGHLGAVLILALFAEEGCAVRRKPSVQVAQILEALVAYRVDSLETLAGGDSGLEDE